MLIYDLQRMNVGVHGRKLGRNLVKKKGKSAHERRYE